MAKDRQARRAAMLLSKKGLKSSTAPKAPKKPRPSSVTDLSPDLLLHIFSFAAKRPTSYHYQIGGQKVFLNDVCRTWYLATEAHRQGGLFKTAFGYLHDLITKRHAADSSKGRGCRSAPISPEGGVMIKAGVRPEDLTLTPLSQTPPPSSGAAAAELMRRPPTSPKGAEGLLVCYLANGGTVTALADVLLSTFKWGCSLLSPDRTMIPREEQQRRRREHYQITDLIAYSISELGVDSNAVDRNGRNLLHLACLYRDLYTLKTILPLGCNHTARDRKKQTPLHIAAGVGCVEACQYLLARDQGHVESSLMKKDAVGKTPLELAQHFNHSQCATAIHKKMTKMLERSGNVLTRQEQDDEIGEGHNGLTDSPLTHTSSNPYASSGWKEKGVPRGVGDMVAVLGRDGSPPRHVDVVVEKKKKSRKKKAAACDMDDIDEKALAYDLLYH